LCISLLSTADGAEPAPAATAETGGQQTVQIDDLYNYDATIDLTVSPNQNEAVYVRDWADRTHPVRRTTLWRVVEKVENRHPLEEGCPDGRKPLYSLDGKWIAFQSTRPWPDGSAAFAPVPTWSDPATDVWLIPAQGGRAIPLSGKAKPYGRVFSDPFYAGVAFSPDGKRLAFVADDGRDPRSPEEIARHVTVVREDQGEGYEGFGAAQIWVADLPDNLPDKLADDVGQVAALRVRRLTNDDAWYGDPQWSPDGKSLVVHANRTQDRESVRFSINKNFDLWRIEVETGRMDRLTSGPGPEVSPRFSPDGRRLACLSVPRKGPHADVYNLLILDLESAMPNGRILFDQHAAGTQAAPHLPPSFPLPTDLWVDNHLLSYSAVQGLESRQQFVDVDDPEARGRSTGPEPAARVASREARRRLIPPSQTWTSGRLLAKDRIVQWKSTDGLAIDGVLTVPLEQVAKPPCKLVVFPHGGPHSRSSLGANFTVQVFAAQGYAVFQPNFRGTSGYGLKFLDADRGDFGGGDMHDIQSGIEHLVQAGLVDRGRQFVYGVSYGGYMTCWLVGHTQQFRAAAALNAVTDLNAMWGLSDLQSWTDWEFGGRPWEVPDALRTHSPLTYAAKVMTPMLILHADHDRRCPLAMGRMFYRALQKNGVETQMVVYHDERHALLELRHQEDLHRRVLAWFAMHDVQEQNK
jgi:dipeptidyl aminopeptidase/acylaminoacyl peptidase